jgi:sugar phosphate isomerase/epimerase
VKLGVNAAFAVKRWPEPEAYLELVRDRLGLDLIQFSLDQLDPRGLQPTVMREAARIRRTAERLGIAIHSAQVGLAGYSFNLLLHPDAGLREDGVQWCEAAICLAAAVGAKGFGGPMGALGVRDAGSPSRREYLLAWELEAIGRLSDAARAEGLEFLLWEPTPLAREFPSTIEETRVFVERAAAVAAVPMTLCLDVGHACRPGASGEDADPFAWIRHFGRRASVIHLQQTDGHGDRHWPFTPAYEASGIVTGERLLDAVRAAGCEAVPLVLEIFHPFEAPDQQVVDDLAASAAYWKRQLAGWEAVTT